MLADFVLAVAVICPAANQVAVKEILTTKPIPYEECDKMSQDDKLREEYLPQLAVDTGCEPDLICVRVFWGD